MNKALKLLLIEANKYHAVLLGKEIQERHPDASLWTVCTGQAGINEIGYRDFDVAVIDFNELQDFDGLQLLEIIRQKDFRLSIIILTARDSEWIASEAGRLGAAEVIVKDSAFHQVIPRVIGEVYRRKQLILRNQDLEQRLKEKTQTDAVKLAAGTLAHEVNNPLMTILGVTELILGDESLQDKELSRKLRIIRRSARRIRNSLSRLECISETAVKTTIAGKIIDHRKCPSDLPKASNKATK